MSKELKTKIGIGVSLLAIVVVGGLSFNYFNKQQNAAAKQKYQEVSQLLIKHDYNGAIKASNDYLIQHPNDLNFLYLNGAAKFNTGDYDGAKTDFQAILSIDPQNVVAQNYLDTLNQDSAKILVKESDLADLELTRQQFEALIGVTMDPKSLIFSQAIKHPANDYFSESVFATYTFSKKSSDIFTYVVSQIKKLKPASIDVDNTNLQATAKLNDQETVRIIVYDQTHQAIIEYAKLK